MVRVILRSVLSLRRCSLGTTEDGFTRGAKPNICVSLHSFFYPLFHNGKMRSNGTGWRTSDSSSQILLVFYLLWFFFSLSRNKNLMMFLVMPLFFSTKGFLSFCGKCSLLVCLYYKNVFLCILLMRRMYTVLNPSSFSVL